MKNLFYLLCSIVIMAIVVISCEKTSLNDATLSIEDSQMSVNGPTFENVQAKKNGCVNIQSGTLVASDGETITTGYNDFGYNYQAHMFNGEYSPGWQLVMKWSDSWLSNQDCDDDGLLDRHLGYPSYIGSGAWLTNHQKGTYTDVDGNECNWNYFVKIVAAPTDATASGGVWYNADGIEIGPVIWGQFAIVQQVENDGCAGIHGLQMNSPDHAGLGNW